MHPLLIILSHAASDVFVKQWYDAKVPVPIGGIDVKSQDADFFKRVGGKAVSEVTTNFVLRKPITEKSIPWWDAFIKKYNRAPVYSAAGAYDAVYVYGRRCHPGEDHRHRRGDQGAGKDRLRQPARPREVRRAARSPGRPRKRQCYLCAVASRRRARGRVAEGSRLGQDDRSALDDEELTRGAPPCWTSSYTALSSAPYMLCLRSASRLSSASRAFSILHMAPSTRSARIAFIH